MTDEASRRYPVDVEVAAEIDDIYSRRCGFNPDDCTEAKEMAEVVAVAVAA